MGGATHQLLVADGEVGHLSPAHRHRVKAAVRFPAEDPQRVRGAAVQAGAVWAKTYTPETTGTGVRGHSPVTPCCNGKNSPDRSRVALQRADHRKLLQIPQLDGPANTCRVHKAAAHQTHL